MKKIEKLNEIYPEYTDKYFLRAKQILKKKGINPIVRYQVFARQDIDALEGVDEAVEFIKQVVGDKAKVYALRDGQNYKAKEPIMKIEGRAQDLIDLETVYLSILSGKFTGEIDLNELRKKAGAVVNAAEGKPVHYFGARHFASQLDEKIAKICQKEGFAGTSTDIGAKAWNAKGFGTIPHALILIYASYMNENNIKGNPTVNAAKGFDKYIDKKVPRIVLIDTFNHEIEDSIETAKEVSIKGIRIDTCGENYAQYAQTQIIPLIDVPEKYLKGKGVTIQAVWALRKGLDDAGFGDLEMTVSSGFNKEKTTAFVKADKIYSEKFGKTLFDSIGTGSLAKPVMTTSDIVAYYNEKKQIWIPLSKVGRGEIKSNRLEEII